MFENTVDETLYWLRGYQKRVDLQGDFNKDSMLYFKKLKSGHFIVIAHLNRKGKLNTQCFDAWICDYLDNEEPGTAEPTSMKELRLGITFPADLNLIREVS